MVIDGQQNVISSLSSLIYIDGLLNIRLICLANVVHSVDNLL